MHMWVEQSFARFQKAHGSLGSEAPEAPDPRTRNPVQTILELGSSPPRSGSVPADWPQVGWVGWGMWKVLMLADAGCSNPQPCQDTLL